MNIKITLSNGNAYLLAGKETDVGLVGKLESDKDGSRFLHLASGQYIRMRDVSTVEEWTEAKRKESESLALTKSLFNL